MVLRGSNTKGTTVQNFVYGGLAGATARTVIAPLDRVKILMQVQTSKQTLSQMFRHVFQKEGFLSLWKGNVINCSRIIPYSGLQFATYDLCKSVVHQQDVTITQRLACGSVAGAVAATVTHPMDVVRHRLLMNADIHTFGQAFHDIRRTGTIRPFFKGYGSTMVGLVPFIAFNFCTFDTIKSYLQWTSVPGVLTMGATAAIVSQTACYPLDTIRRRMQVRDTPYRHGLHALWNILRHEGVLKLYAGMSANALKIVPNNGIRFLVYELCKRSLEM